MNDISTIIDTLESGRAGALFRNTSENLLSRIEPDGWFGESLTGKYPGCFPRSMGAFALERLDAGDAVRARQLISL